MIRAAGLLNRRQILLGTAASVVGLVSPGLLISTRPAHAIEPVTMVMIGLAIASSIAALNAKGGGLGEQFAAFHLKLDQILQNQIYTLEAIQQLQKSITRLENQIGGLFTEERYKDLAIEILNLRTDTSRFLRSIISLPKGTTLNPTKKAEYNRLLSTLGNLVSKTENTFLLTNLTEKKAGLKGIDSLLIITPALPVLISLLDTYRNLETLFPDLGLEASEYLAASETMKSALKTFTGQRIPEALSAQVNEAKAAMDEVKKNSLGAILVDILTPSEQPTSKDICFQTPGYTQTRPGGQETGSFAILMNEYRLLRKIAFRYSSVTFSGVSPAETIFPRIELQPRAGWKLENVEKIRGRVFINIDGVGRVMEGPAWVSAPAVSGCYDGIGLIRPPRNIQYGTPDDEGFVQNFNAFLARLARYNNAAISQAQMIAMTELGKTLTEALAKFARPFSQNRLNTSAQKVAHDENSTAPLFHRAHCNFLGPALLAVRAKLGRILEGCWPARCQR